LGTRQPESGRIVTHRDGSTTYYPDKNIGLRGQAVNKPQVKENQWEYKGGPRQPTQKAHTFQGRTFQNKQRHQRNRDGDVEMADGKAVEPFPDNLPADHPANNIHYD
jgi:hypothetical protein